MTINSRYKQSHLIGPGVPAEVLKELERAIGDYDREHAELHHRFNREHKQLEKKFLDLKDELFRKLADAVGIGEDFDPDEGWIVSLEHLPHTGHGFLCQLRGRGDDPFAGLEDDSPEEDGPPPGTRLN